MILAIDSGNTHTTIGCIDESNNVKNIFRLPSDKTETEYGYAAKMKQIFDLASVDISAFEGVVISSVVPPLTSILVKAIRLLTGLDALVVGAGIKTGLHICINDPGTVASDLVASAVAAKDEYPLPCIIIDMGTATTLTVVDEKGRYIGGAILPGVALSLNALSEQTALLPKIEILPPRSAISTNTVDCMKSGIVYGTAGSIDGIIDKFVSEMPVPPATVVATGGNSSLICPYCRHEMILDQTLLLKGLYSIWKRNLK